MANRHTDLSNALDVLARLEGTLLADTSSLVDHARTLAVEPAAAGAGHLNFALALVSLVACEAIGYFTTGAAKHRAADRTCNVDPGACIVSFIERFFPRRHPFKRISKILADDAGGWTTLG